MCCSVLQCFQCVVQVCLYLCPGIRYLVCLYIVAVYCSVLHCVAVCCSVLPCVAVRRDGVSVSVPVD